MSRHRLNGFATFGVVLSLFLCSAGLGQSHGGLEQSEMVEYAAVPMGPEYLGTFSPAGEDCDVELTDSIGNVTAYSGFAGPTEIAFLADEPVPFGSYHVDLISLAGEILFSGTVVVVETDPQDPEEPAHRGRIQIQGPDMDEEISWAWAQDTPPTKADGLRELDRLYNSLTNRQKRARADAYAKARKWIRELPAAGVDAQVSKSWGNKDDKSKRIDIEVIKGKAFTGEDPEADDDDELNAEETTNGIDP